MHIVSPPGTAHNRTMTLPYRQSSALAELAAQVQSEGIAPLFAREAGRVTACTVEAAGLRLDYSRNLVSAPALAGLLDLGQAAGLSELRSALFDGSVLNFTERRAACHTLLRASSAPAGLAEQHAAVTECLGRMADWVERVHDGRHRGFRGDGIRCVVNLGIGGSDLGPRLVCQALAPYRQPDLEVRFCANIDVAELQHTLDPLNPGTTLFIICSKSLGTRETLANAGAARDWLLAAGCPPEQLQQHLLAVTGNLSGARELGIPEANILPLWDWVGGRYSLWSGIGWSIAMAVGNHHFRQLLAGAEAMDQHFAKAPPGQNMPLLLSLLEIWQVNFLGARNHAVVPYSHRLRRLPAFLQQLTMESNGKRVNRDGQVVPYHTAPVLWGDEGSNSQHSFHQLLHQGTDPCPVDFILPLYAEDPDCDRQRELVANCLAQARALQSGRTLAQCRDALLEAGVSRAAARELAPHLLMPGNRSSNLISLQRLDPASLGALLALYEHRTCCSGQIWQINSFDQYGVELGKLLSGAILGALRGEGGELDSSTEALLQHRVALSTADQLQ